MPATTTRSLGNFRATASGGRRIPAAMSGKGGEEREPGVRGRDARFRRTVPRSVSLPMPSSGGRRIPGRPRRGVSRGSGRFRTAGTGRGPIGDPGPRGRVASRPLPGSGWARSASPPRDPRNDPAHPRTARKSPARGASAIPAVGNGDSSAVRRLSAGDGAGLERRRADQPGGQERPRPPRMCPWRWGTAWPPSRPELNTSR